jgi:hypothetical protein
LGPGWLRDESVAFGDQRVGQSGEQDVEAAFEFGGAVGRLTGSRRLRAEGRRDRVKGNMKQAGAKVKDAVKR